MSNLVLPSLEIRNFRAFSRLRIERLGRVNLITGKNNVGKTSLLEAVWLYARGASPYQLQDLLTARNELRLRPRGTSIEEDENQYRNIKHLFYGHQEIDKLHDPISIGPIVFRSRTLSISIRWRQNNAEEQSQSALSLSKEGKSLDDFTPYIEIRTRKQVGYSYPLPQINRREASSYLTAPDTIISPFVKANGLDTAQISSLWDKIALTDLEGDVLNALRIIAPEVQRINLIGEEGLQGRIPIVKIASQAEPVPLRSLGEGMNRLFGLILAVVNAKDGLLLLDEVESGLHYSVLPEVWRLIFTVAQRLNVQVFATTHSWDCITAFQEAAAENAEEEGVLIRLETKKGEIAATTFDESKLTIATREQIEVR